MYLTDARHKHHLYQGHSYARAGLPSVGEAIIINIIHVHVGISFAMASDSILGAISRITSHRSGLAVPKCSLSREEPLGVIVTPRV